MDLSHPLPALARLANSVTGRASTWKKGLRVRVTAVTDDGLIVVERIRPVGKSKLQPQGLRLFSEMICLPSDVEVENPAATCQ